MGWLITLARSAEYFAPGVFGVGQHHAQKVCAFIQWLIGCNGSRRGLGCVAVRTLHDAHHQARIHTEEVRGGYHYQAAEAEFEAATAHAAAAAATHVLEIAAASAATPFHQLFSSSHTLATVAKSVDCGRTMQKRWPVGASITIQRFTRATRFAPNPSSRRASASRSSASMSRCTRLGCCTCCTSTCRSPGAFCNSL